MTPPVHVEGMGLLGSLLAYRLDQLGVPFTWHDAERKITAWRACTGLVYPAGDRRSQLNLREWERWHRERFLPDGLVIPASYVYAHKAPPHEGDYRTVRLAPGMTLAHAPSFAVDAPQLVAAARAQFATRRLETGRAARLLIRAHGGHRATSVMWGWSAPVRLGLPAELQQLPARPAFYGRRVRRLVYAYPIPTRPGWWWAGSTLVRQSRPGHLDARKHYERWLADWQVTWPAVPVLDVEAPVEGWRPRPSDADAGALDVVPGQVTFPALWHSGVRWAPQLIEEAARVAWGQFGTAGRLASA